ncbi:MAG: radical SAM protein, partial [Verrucomicrobia bacterium]|nr:radical SAM protein [Verrucomicrobiota bacterium]
LAEADRLEAILDAARPDFVGISLRNIDDVLIRKQETFFDELASLCVRIRQHTEAPIILGGSGFSLFPERLLALAGTDYGICGAGEDSLVSLIAALESGSGVNGIPGLVFRQNGSIVVNGPANHSMGHDLTEADRPAVISQHYLQASGILNLQTQRGCGCRCCYCTYPVIEGKQHRRRSAEAVAAEFEQLQRLGARYVFIVDSIFNSSPRHVTEICEAILRRNVKVAWGCFLRPRGLTPDLMRLMAKAGLTHIEFGSDSFSDEVLTAYQKDFTFDDILQSSEQARLANVDFCHFLICGGPGETRATLSQSFENSQRLAGATILAVVGMRIYPGTPLFERAVGEGRISRDTDLLTPAYYLAPDLTAESVFAQLEEFAHLSPSWIVGDPPPAYASLVRRLRGRGVVGPLWSYFAILQRVRPLASAAPRS